MFVALNRKTASLLFTLLTLFSASCFAVITPQRQQAVTVCDATIQPDWPVDFTATTCQHLALADVDPQGKTLWLQLTLSVSKQQLTLLKPPLAL